MAWVPLVAGGCADGVVVARATNAPIPHAHVGLSSSSNRLQTLSDDQGLFVFAQVPPGDNYKLTVEAPGFAPFVRDSISLPCTTTTSLKAELNLAPVTEAITVEDRVEVIKANAPEVSQSVSAQQLTELPSNGRNWTRFALLDPHVRNTGGLGADGPAGARLSINASSFRHTSYALDGVTNYDTIFANAPQQNLSLSSVQELKVLTNQYSADYGGSSAGIVVATTRAGSNQYHGDAFAFLRPSGIQAAPPVSTFRIPNERLQWGGSAGGPIVRDRTWFFASYERIGQERGSYIQSPAPAFFPGEFEESIGLVRLDRNWSPRHSSTLRLNGNHAQNNNVNDRVGAFTQPSAAQNSVQQAAGLQASDRFVLGEWLQEFRAGYTDYIPSLSRALSPQVSVVRPNYSTEGGSAYSWVRAKSLQLADTLSLFRGNHQLRFGGDYLRVTAADFSNTPYGEYRFAAGPPAPSQKPQSYSQTFGTASIRYGQTIANAFVQDDWRLRPNFVLNLGLRYERQSIVTERNLFAPRLGFAWDVRRDGRTVVRGGAGVFFDQYYLYITRRFYLQGLSSPTTSYSIPFGTPGFPTFPESLAEPPVGLSAGKRDLYLPAGRLTNPYSLQFSLGVQHRVGDWVFSLDGMHNHTLRQMRAYDLNHPAPFERTQPGQRRAGAEADATRPYATWSGVPVRSVISVENSASSLYDSLDVGVQKRLGKRFQIDAHYVWSSSATYAMFFGEPNTGIPNDWGDTGRSERAVSDFYQRHRFVASSLLQLPCQVQLSLVGTLASGLPVNPLTGADNNGDTFSSDRPVGFGRNSFRAPAQAGFDLALGRQFALSERVRLEVRGEVFNVFNRVNPIKVNSVYGEGPAPLASFLAPIAGVANVDPARQFQALVRLRF